MTNKERFAGTVLLSAAGDMDWDRVAGALDDVLPEVLRRLHKLPGGLREAVLRHSSDSQLAALIQRCHDDDALHRRIVETCPCGPQVLRALPPPMQRVLLSSPPERACWHGPDGLRASLLRDPYPGLQSAIVAPFADVVRNAIVRSRLTEAERHRAELNLHELEGTEVPAGLAARTAALEGTAGLIDELRDDPAHSGGPSLQARPVVEWPMVVEAHRRKPFPASVVQRLAARPDCSADALEAFYRTASGAVVHGARRAHPGLLALPASAPAPDKAVADLVTILVEDGHAARILREARPAGAVLSAVLRRTAAPGWGPLVDELADLVAEHLGEDSRAWERMRVQLRRFDGTIAELFDGRRGGRRAVSGPVPTGAVRSAMAGLLSVAETVVQMTVLTGLDAPTTGLLLTLSPFRADWIDHITTYGTAAQRALLAARPELSTTELDRLLDLGEPLVDANVHRHLAAGRPQRERILGRVLDPAFRRMLLDGTGLRHPRDAVVCADPELQWRILERVHVDGEVPQLRMLLNVWRRRGTERMLELHGDLKIRHVDPKRPPFLPAVDKALTDLLAIGDEAAAVDTLTARLAHAESARGQIEALRDPDRDPAALLAESHLWHWPEILAAHRDEPFADEVFGRLAHVDDCPPEVRAEAERVLVALSPAERSILNGADVAEVIGRKPLADRHEERAWIRRALSAGRLSTSDLLAYARPAVAALALIGDLIESPPPAFDPERARATLSDMVRHTLGTDQGAWILAMRLIGEFDGPVAELLATAATVMGTETR